MITADGWARYCIWEHSSTVKDLYARRCRMEAEEMTCAIPASRLGEIVAALESTVTLDRAMASYASADAKRFI